MWVPPYHDHSLTNDGWLVVHLGDLLLVTCVVLAARMLVFITFVDFDQVAGHVQLVRSFQRATAERPHGNAATDQVRGTEMFVQIVAPNMLDTRLTGGFAVT
jgi:hypothetical protein